MGEKLTHIFLHIPKTAGTTLRSIIEKNYQGRTVYRIEHDILKSLKNFKKLALKDRNQFELIYGHLPFGFHEYLTNQCRYFTFLRDPVERVISQYYYVKENKWHYLYETIHKYRMSLEDYVSSGVCTELNNGQTRLLAGYLSGATNLAKDVEFGKATEDMLRKAKKNVEEYFDVVGITEKFDDSLKLLQKIMGWKDISYKKVNVTKSRIRFRAFTKDIKNKVIEYNKLDAELYNWWCEVSSKTPGRTKNRGQEEKVGIRVDRSLINKRINGLSAGARERFLILVGTHHKTGTLWLKNIFREVAAEMGLIFLSLAAKRDEKVYPLEVCDILFQDHSRFDLENILYYRGVHLIRDPRDMIISGCFYHQTSSEPWLHVKRREFGGKSYQEKLNSFKDIEDQLLFEMENAGYVNITDMAQWNYDDKEFFEIKYEDLIVDFKLKYFTRIFSFLGFDEKHLKKLNTIAYRYSIFSKKIKKNGHIRSGKADQWRDYFGRSQKERFVELFGDILIRLGYEANNEWVA